MTSNHTRVTELLRRDLQHVPSTEILNAVGDTFPALEPKDPIREWWGIHKIQGMRREPDPQTIEAANAAFLNSQGVELEDDINLDF